MLPVLKPVTKLTKGGGQTASMKAHHTSISNSHNICYGTK